MQPSCRPAAGSPCTLYLTRCHGNPNKKKKEKEKSTNIYFVDCSCTRGILSSPAMNFTKHKALVRQKVIQAESAHVALWQALPSHCTQRESSRLRSSIRYSALWASESIMTFPVPCPEQSSKLHRYIHPISIGTFIHHLADLSIVSRSVREPFKPSAKRIRLLHRHWYRVEGLFPLT